MEINGKKVLSYILERLLEVVTADQIVIATSDSESDDAINSFALDSGVSCYRGSLENVAQRFYDAAHSQAWEYAVRINGDNLFVDIPTLSSMIEIAETGGFNFISNVKDRTFPKGMSIEIVKLDYYQQMLHRIEQDSNYSEHVTLLLYHLSEAVDHKYVFNTQVKDAQGLDLALDTPEDFDRMTRLIEQMNRAHTAYNMRDIVELNKSLIDEKL